MSEPTKPITDSIDSLAIEADCARLKYESALRNSLIAARKEAERYRAALLNLYGQVDQARTGFGIYADSPSMNAAMEEAKALLHPTQPAEGSEK